ncbi:hypothetical protein [Alkalinema sp. FACHB-956]|uniref:hypothetical protein n=1 Tax=Alkalinema sp. FACHB-956 TaxID=2692768 RepID=UPI0016844A0D|nr:hypothetical protein [Alkalinema sp. FACHB-956]MBD2327630.1 hypothetical protein [Alkalinema sp. FACHB-956]
MGILELLVLGVYAGGAWKFWTGFQRTNFQDNKVPLTLLWPLFFAVNKSYRQNFNKALKG